MLLNKERVRMIMEREGLDALVATSPENVLYTSDLYLRGQWLFGLYAYVIIPINEDVEPAVICPLFDADSVAVTDSWIHDTYYHGTFHVDFCERVALSEEEKALRKERRAGEAADPVDILVKVLNQRGLEEGRIGFDEKNLTPVLWKNIESKLPMAEIFPASTHFRQTRMVKTEEEIHRMRNAAQLNEKAIRIAMESATEGITERNMIKTLRGILVGEGAEPIFTVIGFGRRGAFTNNEPSDEKLKRRDSIRFNIVSTKEQYYADMARTAVLGEPTKRHKRYYNSVLRGQQAAIEKVKPGVKASEVFKAAVKATREGIPHYQRHQCGHGLGLVCYDMPLLAPQSKTLLETGMVLCVETPYYEVGWGGLMVEDTVLVVKEGYEYITKSNRELVVL